MSVAPARLTLDAMGGDHAPSVVIEGAVLAAREFDVEVVLVGREEAIRHELAKHDTTGLRLPAVHAEEVVGMEEHAAGTFRQKRQSSIAVGVNLVREGQAAGFVSAGNSGAVMASALFGLGRIAGVERPGLGTLFPATSGRCFVIDVGANADCKPEYLVQFAIMGSAYMEHVHGLKAPRVGILSNGEEDTKGNALVQATYPLLRASSLNFIGSVEGKDVPQGMADVVVTDGFSGNILIKTSEGVGAALFDLLRKELTSSTVNKLAAAVLKPAFRRVARHLDYAEFGGAHLLGVNGVVVISHGRSNARAIRSALGVAKLAVERGLVEATRAGLAAAVASTRA